MLEPGQETWLSERPVVLWGPLTEWVLPQFSPVSLPGLCRVSPDRGRSAGAQRRDDQGTAQRGSAPGFPDAGGNDSSSQGRPVPQPRGAAGESGEPLRGALPPCCSVPRHRLLLLPHPGCWQGYALPRPKHLSRCCRGAQPSTKAWPSQREPCAEDGASTACCCGWSIPGPSAGQVSLMHGCLKPQSEAGNSLADAAGPGCLPGLQGQPGADATVPQCHGGGGIPTAASSCCTTMPGLAAWMRTAGRRSTR